jgi:predicted aconitase
MKLTSEQDSMLAGKCGSALELAMKMLVAVGRAMDAPALIPVSSAHIVIDAFAMGKPGADLIVSIAEGGGRFVVPSTINAISYDRDVGPDPHVVQDFDTHQKRMLDACQAMGGIATCSCNPFSQGIAPRFGEHVSWSESATTGYLNSVIGARSNREGATAIASALTGLTPLYGMHDPARRHASIHFEIDVTPRDDSEFNLLGSLVARKAGDKIPVLTGVKDPGVDALFGFGASFAISANIPMFHIVGVTPEAPTLKDATAGVNVKTDHVTVGELQAERRRYDADASRKIDLVTIGAPHANIAQIKEVVDLLDGRNVKEDVIFTLTTNRSNFAVAESSGLLAKLKAAGVVVTADRMCFGCDLGARKYHRGAVLATNSVKAAMSAPGTRGVRTRYGTSRQCVDAAVSGEWGDG